MEMRLDNQPILKDIPANEAEDAFGSGLQLALPAIHSLQGEDFRGQDGFAVACYIGDVGKLHSPKAEVDTSKFQVRKFGNESEWQYPYDRIAVSKLHLTVMFGTPTRALQADHRDQLLKVCAGLGFDVTSYFGSAMKGNLVTSVSGFDPNADEASAVILNEMIYLPYNVDNDEIQPVRPAPGADEYGFFSV